MLGAGGGAKQQPALEAADASGANSELRVLTMDPADVQRVRSVGAPAISGGPWRFRLSRALAQPGSSAAEGPTLIDLREDVAIRSPKPARFDVLKPVCARNACGLSHFQILSRLRYVDGYLPGLLRTSGVYGGNGFARGPVGSTDELRFKDQSGRLGGMGCHDALR